MRYGGYAGRLLRVDLSRGRVEQQETSDYLPEWYGGRAMAARIAWAASPNAVMAIYDGCWWQARWLSCVTQSAMAHAAHGSSSC